jgi:hypothetical protein
MSSDLFEQVHLSINEVIERLEGELGVDPNERQPNPNLKPGKVYSYSQLDGEGIRAPDDRSHGGYETHKATLSTIFFVRVDNEREIAGKMAEMSLRLEQAIAKVDASHRQGKRKQGVTLYGINSTGETSCTVTQLIQKETHQNRVFEVSVIGSAVLKFSIWRSANGILFAERQTS